MRSPSALLSVTPSPLRRPPRSPRPAPRPAQVAPAAPGRRAGAGAGGRRCGGGPGRARPDRGRVRPASSLLPPRCWRRSRRGRARRSSPGTRGRAGRVRRSGWSLRLLGAVVLSDRSVAVGLVVASAVGAGFVPLAGLDDRCESVVEVEPDQQADEGVSFDAAALGETAERGGRQAGSAADAAPGEGEAAAFGVEASVEFRDVESVGTHAAASPRGPERPCAALAAPRTSRAPPAASWAP